MRRRTVALAVLGLLLVGAGVAVVLPRVADDLPKPLGEVARLPLRVWTRFSPPRLAEGVRLSGLTDPEREAVRVLGQRLSGLVVWSSNRTGNHELYLLDLGAATLRRLTDDPAVDFFSRVSPDGRQIVFLRSQREWVSFREGSAWDVLLVNVDGTGERRIARGGYHPTWTADGRAIIFLRGFRVFRYDLATNREELLVDPQRDIAENAEIGDVELSPDHRRLTFGIRKLFSGAAVLDLETGALTPLTRMQACQPTWAPDGEALAWVETRGRGGTRVMTGRPDGRDRRVLMDLPGDYSHEYFPKFSSDGRWLIWGAAAKGHEHDRADYEIFVWEVGTPWETAVRLTYHPGNDQWPDLWMPARAAGEGVR